MSTSTLMVSQNYTAVSLSLHDHSRVYYIEFSSFLLYVPVQIAGLIAEIPMVPLFPISIDSQSESIEVHDYVK